MHREHSHTTRRAHMMSHEDSSCRGDSLPTSLESRRVFSRSHLDDRVRVADGAPVVKGEVRHSLVADALGPHAAELVL